MKKILSKILSLILLVNIIQISVFSVPVYASGITGNIEVCLNLTYPEAKKGLSQKNIALTLVSGASASSKIYLNSHLENTQTVTFNGVRYSAKVVPQNKYGTPITTESYVNRFAVEVYNLPSGTYNVQFEGNGYTTYASPVMQLSTHSKYLEVNSKNGKFSMGDVNNDRYITKTDVELISENLGTIDKQYDLNGDGIVDITDVTYANHNIHAKGSVEVFDTSVIVASLANVSATQAQLKGTLATGQDIGNLFRKSSEPVKISALNQSTPIEIPITFNSPTLLEQIQIQSPAAVGAVSRGTATVLYQENGTDKTDVIPFSKGQEEGVAYLESTEGTSSVIIDLGKRVAVKKVTITVEKVDGQEGKPSFTVIEEIKFLKDIVSSSGNLENTTIPKNVAAAVGDEQVTLSWNAVANVTGYKIKYGTKSGVYDQEVSTDANTIVIKQLKNLTNYYFVVLATAQGWEGVASKEVSAMPLPAHAPNPPDNLRLTSDSQNIFATWSSTLNSTGYNVYFKKSNESTYTKKASGITQTSFTIPSLETNVNYDVYVTAVNSFGESRPSIVSTIKTEQRATETIVLPTLNRIPNSEIVSAVMTNPNNIADSFYINGTNSFRTTNVYDNNFETHWTARVFWESHEFTFTFNTPKEMNYLIYVPRLDGKYKESLYKYTINVWNSSGEKTTVAAGLQVQNNPATTGYAVLPFPRTADIKKIAVDVIQWDGSPTDVSLSEIAFYSYDGLADQIEGLFADGSHTTLSSTATQATINSLKTRLENANGYYVDKAILLEELQLAEALLSGNSTLLGKVISKIDSRNTTRDIKAINTFQPLGIVATAGTQVVVYAKIPAGEEVSIVPTQYFAEASAWKGSPIKLTNGRNIIRIPQIGTVSSERGGALYLQYSGNKSSDIKLQIRGGTKIPVLELSNWNTMSETERKNSISAYITELSAYVPTVSGNKQTAIRNSTEISMPNVLLSLPADQILAGINKDAATLQNKIDKLYSNTLAWNDLIKITYKTHGIDDPLTEHSRQNIRYARMFANAFMYASGEHIGIGYGSAAALVQGRPVSETGGTSNALFGWGIAHEIGHVLDTLGKAEVTNNIYSLYAQTYNGSTDTLTSRLEASTYKDIFNKTAIGAVGTSNNVFVSLGMYWQLHLAYDGAGENFYNKLNKEYRKGTGNGFSGDDKFAVVASNVAGKNLTEFFTQWGIRLSDSAKAVIASLPSEPRKIYYLNDNSRRSQLNGTTMPQNVQLTTSLAADKNKITVSIDVDCDKSLIQGYEISRNGVGVGFTNEDKFEDIIGTANNISMNYTVKAIDVLGNVVATKDAGQIKLSNDVAIAKSLYTTAQVDDTITITMNSTQSVAGIKINRAVTETGTFDVLVKKGSGEFVKSATVDLSKNSSANAETYVSFFNKPNTNESSIWTYDADVIQIKGLPSTIALDELDIVAYPGDNVDVTNFGYLQADFVYGTGADDVIKAGTLVITGNYRGNPEFNTVNIVGKFASGDNSQGVTYVERALNGTAILFAEIPASGEVSTVSNGIWVFVPDVQKEATLQEANNLNETIVSILPASVKAELYINYTPTDVTNRRLVSNTLWLDVPTQNTMPQISIQGGSQ